MAKRKGSCVSRTRYRDHIAGTHGDCYVESTYLLISHLVADFDDICGDAILKNFDGLWSLQKSC